MHSIDILRQRIDDHSARIAVMGCGYVGLPLALTCAEAGYTVVGVEVDRSLVTQLNQGQSHIQDVCSDALAECVRNGSFRATTDVQELTDCDAIVICVPTPLNKTKEPDVSFIVGALRGIQSVVRSGQLIVLESTTYPGFTREVCLPLLEESSLQCGKDFFLAFSPERTDPGNQKWTVRNTTKILGGITAACTDIASALYAQLLDQVHCVSSTDAAEMSKLLENTFRAVNIGLVNEVALMCQTLGIDTWEVIEAAATKPFGFMPFYPGPGLGGHCIPVDPLYLSWKLRSHNYTARFIELAQTVNASMPRFVVRLAIDALNDQAKALRGSRILVLGVAYKRDVDDIRESPAVEILGLLARKGADVRYVDPHVPRIDVDGVTYHSETLPTALEGVDMALITTDHGAFDFASVVATAPLILDTRNATGGLDLTPDEQGRIVRL